MGARRKVSLETALLMSILDVARDLAAGIRTVTETKQALHRLAYPPFPGDAEEERQRVEQRIRVLREGVA